MHLFELGQLNSLPHDLTSGWDNWYIYENIRVTPRTQIYHYRTFYLHSYTYIEMDVLVRSVNRIFDIPYSKWHIDETVFCGKIGLLDTQDKSVMDNLTSVFISISKFYFDNKRKQYISTNLPAKPVWRRRYAVNYSTF